MVAAAGLVFDVATLFYGGLIVFALAVVLSIHNAMQGSPIPQAVSAVLGEAMPVGLSDNDRALWALKAARTKAAFAQTRAGKQYRQQAYEEVRAALLTAQKRFGIPQLQFKGLDYIPYRVGLEQQVTYIDRFYGLLAEGHIEEAKRAASSCCVITYQDGG